LSGAAWWGYGRDGDFSPFGYAGAAGFCLGGDFHFGKRGVSIYASLLGKRSVNR